jgi:hypothetical protein
LAPANPEEKCESLESAADGRGCQPGSNTAANGPQAFANRIIYEKQAASASRYCASSYFFQ